MKIKIRTAHTHTQTRTQRSAAGQGANEQSSSSPWHLLPASAPVPPCSVDCSATGSDCLSLSCHVKMVLRKCIFCIPSANEQHRYTHPLPPSLPPPRLRCWQFCFLLFVCSLAIFMPLLCLLFAFVSANAFKALRLFSL